MVSHFTVRGSVVLKAKITRAAFFCRRKSNLWLVVSNSSCLLVKILIPLTLVPPILVRSLLPVLGVQLEMVISRPVLEFMGALTELRTWSRNICVMRKNSVVSSAKMSTVAGCDTPLGRSFINTRKSSGESTDPCGTPCVRWRLCTSAYDSVLHAVVKERAHKTQAAFIKTIDTQLFSQHVVAYQIKCFLEVD